MKVEYMNLNLENILVMNIVIQVVKIKEEHIFILYNVKVKINVCKKYIQKKQNIQKKNLNQIFQNNMI